MIKILKKSLKFLGWFVLIVFISLNLFIVLSGRFYLYKGIYSTYLQGESSPTIYDKDKFYSSTVAHGPSNMEWQFKRVGENGLDKYIKYAETWSTA